MLRQIIITTVSIFSLTALINLLCVMPPDPNRDDNAKVKDIILENIFVANSDSNIVLIDKEFDIKLSLMLVYRIDSLIVDLDDGNDTVIIPGEWDTLLTLKHLYNSTGKKVIEATIYTETAKPKTSTITAIVVRPAKLLEKEISVLRNPDSVSKGLKLSVYANGSGNIEYSWFKDTSLIFKSDDSVYTVDSLTETDTGEYLCIVSNSYGSDTSLSYTLTLNEYLSPVIQNERKIFSEGEMKIDSRCFLYITASGSQKLTYQWYKDNNVIINETSDTLVFSSLLVDDNGVYKCVVTNEYGSDTSLEYTIEVFENVKPIIQNNKEIVVSGSLFKSSTVTLSINASGTEPLSYSWYKEGSETVLSTEPKLTLEKLSSEAEGEYYCIVSNSFGKDTSVSIEIKLIPESKPLPVILNEKAVQTKGPPVTDSLLKLYIEVENDGKTVNYQWFKDDNDIENETSDTLVFSSLSVDDNGVYKCVVTNEHGSDTSLEYTIKVGENIKPIIQNNKEVTISGSLFKDSTVTLSISVSGTEPLSYSWYKNGFETVLSTEPILTLKDLSSGTEGEYFCIVKNTAGRDTCKVYRVKLKNRKPVLISQLDTFKLIENQSETVEIELDITDPDDDIVCWKIIKAPVKGTVSSDSGIIPADKPLFAYTLKPDSNEIDSIVVEYGDKELYDSLTLYFQIEPVNKPPVIIRNLGQVLNEGETCFITSSRLQIGDPDNSQSDLIVTVTELPKNGKLLTEETEVKNNYQCTVEEFVAGNLKYTHNSSETLADSFIIAIFDGDFTIESTFIFDINPVNDIPEFSKKPDEMISKAGIGNLYCDSVKLFDIESDYSQMIISVSPEEAQYFFSPSDSYIKLHWLVDNQKYSINQKIPLEIAVIDKDDSVSLKWDVEIIKHKWLKVASDVRSYGTIAALDSFVIFNTYINNNAFVQKYDLRDTGWIDFAEMYVGVPGSFRRLTIKENCLWGEAAWVTGFDLDSREKTFQFCPPGTFRRTFLTSDKKLYGINSCSPPSTDKYYNLYLDTIKNNTISPPSMLGDTIEIVYNDICFYNNITFLLKVEKAANSLLNYLARLNLACWENNPIGCNRQDIKIPVDSEAKTFISDNNDGDSLYILFENNTLIRVPNSFAQLESLIFEQVKHANSLSPIQIAMIDGKNGFLVSENGKLYSTNDGFATTNEENVETNFRIRGVFVSADKKAVFVRSEQDLSYNINIYRY